MGFEKAIRFDPRPLELRLDGKGVVLADAVQKPSSDGDLSTTTGGNNCNPNFRKHRASVIGPASRDKSSARTPVFRYATRAKGTPALDAVSLADGASAADTFAFARSRLFVVGWIVVRGTLGSRDGLRDFKLVNRLANDDIWDFQTSEKLNSPTAIRADQSFIGNWSTAASCRAEKSANTRLSISSRRAKSSAGSICEFRDVQWNDREWRVRANCSQGTQHWVANGKLALVADRLIWTSERDVISYFRCN